MPAVVHARQVTDDTLVVQLAGNWQLQRGVPELTEIQPQLNDTSRIRQLTFEVLDMLAWDTGLLTFLLQLLDYCHQHQIVVGQSGLPEGVRRLLALATAVPEREGARHGATRLSWLAQVGTATLAAFGGAPTLFRFVGEACLVFGRFLVGQARYRRVDFVLLLQECGALALGIPPHGISGVAAHVGPDADDAAALCVC
jgi:phospholipid/cholesterol/gamma-HCH transport system permease protein